MDERGRRVLAYDDDDAWSAWRDRTPRLHRGHIGRGNRDLHHHHVNRPVECRSHRRPETVWRDRPPSGVRRGQGTALSGDARGIAGDRPLWIGRGHGSGPDTRLLDPGERAGYGLSVCELVVDDQQRDPDPNHSGQLLRRIRAGSTGHGRGSGDRRRRHLQAPDRHAHEGVGSMKPVLVFVGFLTAAAATAEPQRPSGESILKKVDENQASGNRITVYEMTVQGRRGSRTMKAKAWVQGVDRAFTEYLEPPREAGTKMLKLRDQLWTYSPSTDRTIQIAGHMLRQSVMGSDMSYEDLMEDPKLENLYVATVIGDEKLLE